MISETVAYNSIVASQQLHASEHSWQWSADAFGVNCLSEHNSPRSNREELPLPATSGTFGKSGTLQDLLQLHLGLPGHPQRGHVETLVFTKAILGLLAVEPEHQ